MKILTIASGASGSALTHRFISSTLNLNEQHNISLIYTETAELISKEETGISFNTYSFSITNLYDNKSFYAPPASGSTWDFDAVVVIPCSCGFAARVSAGFSSTLAERAVDVALKERTKIVIVPREMPFSTLHLQNLTKLSELGVIVCPACPSYYNHPKSITDVIDGIVGRVQKIIGIDNPLYTKWELKKQ